MEFAEHADLASDVARTGRGLEEEAAAARGLAGETGAVPTAETTAAKASSVAETGPPVEVTPAAETPGTQISRAGAVPSPSPAESVRPVPPVLSAEPKGIEIWEELAKELETTPSKAIPNWNIPGKWRSVKPQAYEFIFGERALPDLNRPGKIQMTLGHIVEKATGGTHSLDNLMPQFNKVNVRLSGIYGRKPFALPLPNGEMKVIESINGKAINGSLREALASFSLDEQRAISYFVTSSVITPELETELAALIKKIPHLKDLVLMP
jgi:hypothetical protein